MERAFADSDGRQQPGRRLQGDAFVLHLAARSTVEERADQRDRPATDLRHRIEPGKSGGELLPARTGPVEAGGGHRAIVLWDSDSMRPMPQSSIRSMDHG